MYLSYSGWKKLGECAYAYWLAYESGLASPAADNMVNSLFGSVVGELFEDFYTLEFWRKERRGGVSSEEFLTARVADKFKEIVRGKKRKGAVLRWRSADPGAIYESKDELLVDIHDAIRKGIQSIRFHRLLGSDAAAEVKLDCVLDGHKIGGRADFIMTRAKPHGDLILLDGKGSKPKNRKYVDPNQLRWYGMLYQHKFNRVPDKMGFLFWRAGPEESIDWLEFTEDDLSELMNDVLEDVASVESRLEDLKTKKSSLSLARQTFKHKPDRFTCRFCPYATDKFCPDGFKLVQQMQDGNSDVA